LVQGAAGRVGTAVRSAGRASPLRHRVSSRPRRGRAARRGRDRLPQRGFPGAGARAPGERGGCCARRARWRDVGSLLPRAAARRKARRVRLLLRAHAGAQEPARVDQVERADRERLSLGPALAPPAGPRLPDRQAAQPPPGVVPGGLPRAARAASPWRDPPGRVRAPTAHRSTPRARTARELGGHGKARARAITRTACGVSRRRAKGETVTVSTTDEEQETGGGVPTSYKNAPTRTVSAGGVDFAYRELGPKGGVPVIFLVHLAGNLDNWDPRVVDGIAAKRRVIAFDNRGVGASTGKTPDTIEAMARDAVTFIRALGFDRVDLHGFSMGGMIAQVIARDEPELVRKLILTGTGPAGGNGMKEVVWVAQLDTLRGLL